MAGDWKEATLAELCTNVAYGYTESATEEKVGPHFLRITDIQNGVVDWHTVPYCPISESDLAKYRLERGDIVVARTGNSTGENYIFDSDEEAVFASYLIRFKIASDKADPRFVWYSMRAPSWWGFVNGSKTGSAQAGANAKVLGRFPLRLPPLSEQKAIAEILGALDAKIELNRRMNETLESLARSLFKSWFVDFDPVRAKMDGRPPPGLPSATAALFPDSFEHQNGELVPQGWSIRKVGDVTHRVTKGDTPRKSAFQAAPEDDRLIPMLRVNAITATGEILRDKMQYIPESIHLGKSKRSILQENDILYTNAGTIGRVSLVQPDLLPANTNQAIAIVRPDMSKVRPAFLFMLLRQPEFQAELHCDIVQAVQANLALGKIADAEAIFPPEDAIPELISPVENYLDRIWANRRESETLAALRDTLLPRLLSGELRVDETLARNTTFCEMS